jgi:cytidylate kinase
VDNYIITIARGFGSGGKRIGVDLGLELGIPCYESQILSMASEYSGINKDRFVEVDERLRNFTSKLKLAPTTNFVLEPTDRHFVSDDNLFNIQAAIIEQLAHTESCIIVGKCANWVLRNYRNVLSIYVEAPRDFCARSVMERLGVGLDEASRLIERTDRYRADYFKHYTKGRDWTDPVLYDLTLNSGRVPPEDCVELIAHYARRKFA